MRIGAEVLVGGHVLLEQDHHMVDLFLRCIEIRDLPRFGYQHECQKSAHTTLSPHHRLIVILAALRTPVLASCYIWIIISDNERTLS